MLNPCAKSSVAPGPRLGATASWKSDGCAPSGTSIATSCASLTASAGVCTVSPPSSAALHEALPSRRPTTTSTPESERLSACACPWLPKPSTATFPERSSTCPDFTISAIGVLSVVVAVLVVGTAQPDAPGARELANPVRAKQLFEGVDVFGTRDYLERDRAVGEVDDLRAGDARRGEHVCARAGRSRNRDERELTLDGVVSTELVDAEHVHELVHLLFDLLERVLAAIDTQRKPRDALVLGRTDREALDVVAAAREQLRDAPQRARLVLELHRQSVLARAGSTSGSGASRTSTAAAPAGTIG